MPSMKTIHISYGGPDRQIRDTTGKAWKFEMHPRFGPIVLDRRGRPAGDQPGSRSPFWSVVQLWAAQGAVIGPDGFCAWTPEPQPDLAPLGGLNYAVAGSKLAEEHGTAERTNNGRTT